MSCETKNAAPYMIKVAIKTIEDYLRYVKIVENLSRQKMLVQTICAMLKSRSVVLSELAHHLNDAVKTASNETRLQDFFREAEFDYDSMAHFLCHFMLSQNGGKIRLSIDRTEWDFGKQQTNILMVTANKGEWTVPLYWEMLDNNSGNSNSQDRIDLLEKCVQLLGSQRIGLLVGDREFIGHVWLKWLKDNKIPFCVRVPKSHLIETEDGTIYNAHHLWTNRPKPVEFKSCLIDGVWGCAKIATDAKGELLYLFGHGIEVKYLEQFYRKRWTIETLFQALKSRGFNLEATHLKHNDRLKKLVGVVAVAYTFCISLGVFRHEKEKPIKIKKHKRKANSFFRYGLEFIRDAFKVGFKYEMQWLDTFTQFCKIFFKNNAFSTS